MLIKINEVSKDFANLEIKQYLSFGIKHSIVKTIIESSMIEENNIKRINFALLSMIKEYILINNYTNLDLSQGEILESYDKLKELGIVEFVLNAIPSNELNFFDEVINQEINQIQKLDNSIEGIIAKGLNQLISKVPDGKEINKMIPKLSKQISKISPENMNFLADVIGWNKGSQNKVGE
jgi:hypothetical protein